MIPNEDVNNEIERLIDEFGGNVLTLYCRFLYRTCDILAAIRILYSRGVDMNVCNHQGSNALFAFFENEQAIAFSKGYVNEILKTLITRGSSVIRHVDSSGKNALWKLLTYTINRPSKIYPAAKILLAHGIPVNYVRPEDDETAFHSFLRKRVFNKFLPSIKISTEEAQDMHELIKLFVQYGLKELELLLTLLCLDRIIHQPMFLETLKLLLGCNRFNMTKFSRLSGTVAVLNACKQRFKIPPESNLPNVIQFLIQNGVDVNSEKIDEESSLIHKNALVEFLTTIPLLDSKGLEVITVLCVNGIDVNYLCHVDPFQKYPTDALRLACKMEKFKACEVLSIARILLMYGARVIPHGGCEDALFCFLAGKFSLIENQILNHDEDTNIDGIDEGLLRVRDFRRRVNESFESWRHVDNDLSALVDEFSEYAELDYPSLERHDELLAADNNGHWEGWYDLIKFLLDNGASANSCSVEDSKNSLMMFVRCYKGEDFVAILELMCQYGPLDVNQRWCVDSNDENSIQLDVLDMFLLNEHQREKISEAALLLLREGLNLGFLMGAKKRNNVITKSIVSGRKKNVIYKIQNKIYDV